MRTTVLFICGIPAVVAGFQAPPSARRAFEQADALVRAGRCGEALPQLEKLFRANPPFAEALFAAGACYTQLGQPAKAEEVLRRYVALEPRAADGRALLGLALLSNGRLGPARAELTQALALDAAQPEAVKALARVHILEGNPARAVTLLRSKANAPDADDELRAILARALVASGDQAGAVAVAEQALAANPRQPVDFYVLTVNALGSLGRTDQAFELCERGMKLYPDSPRLESAYVSLPLQAIGQRLDNRTKRAREDDAGELVSIALLLTSVDRKKAPGAVETAAALLERALKLEPRNARAHFAYGRCLRVLRREEEAAGELRQAASLSSEGRIKVMAYTFLGTTEAQRSRPEAADEAFRKAMELNRRLPVPISEAALEYVHFLDQAGREEEGRPVVEEILRWEPFCYPARMERAKDLADSGAYEAAIQDAELVARNVAGDKDLSRTAHALLARVYHRLGRNEDARRHEAWIRGQ